MPSWLNPATVNTFFLAVFFIAVVAGGWQMARFYAPLVRARFEKQTQQHEAQAQLADALKITIPQQSEQLATHGQTLERVAGQVDEIHQQIIPRLGILKPS